MSADKPIVWTIAGSDSGGGAGIQADLATMTDLGCHACSVIASVTAQNSVAVNGVEPVSESILLAQLDTLLADLPPRAIKIGLLANQRQIHLVADWLLTHIKPLRTKEGQPIPVILDPVMVASCGDALASQGKSAKPTTQPKQGALDFTPFKGVLSLITPNLSEFGRLLGEETTSRDEILTQAKRLSNQLACHLLITGGDKGALWQSEWAEDLFVCNEVAHTSAIHQHRGFCLSSERVDNPNHHGSGCTLSSAIASFLAQGLVLHDAILMAKAYVSQGIRFASAVGAGAGPLARCGWPAGLTSLPLIVDAQMSATSQQPLNFPKLQRPIGVYPVVDRLETLEQVLAAGASTAQLRIKLADDGLVDIKPVGAPDESALEALIKEAIALGRAYDAQVFINDHWQLALKHGAFGIHLGQEDLCSADLEAIAKAGIALGISSHGVFELALAS